MDPAQNISYDELDENQESIKINVNNEQSSSERLDQINKRIDAKFEKQHNSCKLIINSIIFLSFLLLTICKLSIGSFLFYQTLIIMIIFDIYYLFLILTSKNLHWFHYDLIGIDGIMSLAIPSPNHEKEDKFKLIGSISELSAYPGSTSNYIINTTSSYTFIITTAFTIYILDDKYDYNYSKYSTKIITLFMICLASFGFLLAGHWNVFETKLSTILHIIGFFTVYIFSTIAIYIQQNANWLCIVASIICFVVFMIYGYIRHNYVHVQFDDMRSAHKYSFWLVFLEWILVLIIQAQCLVFMMTALHQNI